MSCWRLGLGSGFRTQGLGFKVQGFFLKVLFSVLVLGFRVQGGLGFRV